MARPQMRNGFVMISIELEVAIVVGGFSKYQAIILSEMIAVCYGPSKRPSYLVTSLAIAKSIGADPKSVSRAMNELVIGNTLIDHQNGTYSIQKDWEAWIKTGSHIAAKKQRTPRIGEMEKLHIARVKENFDLPLRDEKKPRLHHARRSESDFRTSKPEFSSQTHDRESNSRVSNCSLSNPSQEGESEFSVSNCSHSNGFRVSNLPPSETPKSDSIPNTIPFTPRTCEMSLAGAGAQAELRINTENNTVVLGSSEVNNKSAHQFARGAPSQELPTPAEPAAVKAAFEWDVPAEPFHAPISNPQPVSRRSSTAEETGRWAKAKLAARYPGSVPGECLDESAAEILEIRVTGWIDDEGYSPSTVKAAIVKATEKVNVAHRVESYAHSILRQNPPKPKAAPTPGKPLNWDGYHRAGPRPVFPPKAKAE